MSTSDVNDKSADKAPAEAQGDWQSVEVPRASIVKATRRSSFLFDRLVLTFGALVVTLAVLAVFWYRGAAWANGQALAAVLVVMAVWLVAGSTVRHRFRFGVRTMLVLMTVAAVLFGLVGKRWYEIQSRRRAIAALEPLGVSVQYRVNRQGDWFKTQSGWLLPSWLVDLFGEDFFSDPYAMGIHQSKIDNDLLAKADVSGIPYIAVCWCDLNDTGMAAFEGLVKLDQLQINDTAITDDGLAHLSECKNLRFLDLHNNHISDAGLKHLAALNELDGLKLDGTRVTGTGLKYLRGKRITSLSLSGAPLCSEGFAQLRHLSALNSLELGGANVTDADFANLSDLTNLQYLDLVGASIGDAGMAHLAGLGNLESLELAGTRVGDDGLKHLAKLRRLGRIGLSRTAVNDAGLVHLENLHSLRQLDVRGTSVTSAGVSRLRQALPECEIWWRPPNSPAGAGVQ